VERVSIQLGIIDAASYLAPPDSLEHYDALAKELLKALEKKEGDPYDEWKNILERYVEEKKNVFYHVLFWKIVYKVYDEFVESQCWKLGADFECIQQHYRQGGGWSAFQSKVRKLYNEMSDKFFLTNEKEFRRLPEA
jgi:hypothetical protein